MSQFLLGHGLLQLERNELAHLIARAHLHPRGRLDLEAHRPLDLRNVLRDPLFQRTVRDFRAVRTRDGKRKHQQREPSHCVVSAHSTFAPAINPTTRATSWPRMTIPSSMSKRDRSASSGASVNVRG